MIGLSIIQLFKIELVISIIDICIREIGLTTYTVKQQKFLSAIIAGRTPKWKLTIIFEESKINF
jgi:hypothetical protein